MYDALVRVVSRLVLVGLVVARAVSAQTTDEAPFEAPDEAEAEVETLPEPPGFELNPIVPLEVPAAPVAADAGVVELTIRRADLTPYFHEGKLREARQAFRQGNFQRTREKLAGLDTPPARFLSALAAFRARDFAAAAEAFEALAPQYEGLADRCWVHAGWAREGLLDFEGAGKAFARTNPRSRMHVDGLLGLARAKRHTGSVKEAIELLEKLGQRPAPPWGRDVGAEALLALAELHQARKDPKAEQQALAALWSKHPLSVQTLRNEKRLLDPDKLPVEVRVTRGEQLIEAHRNAQGQAIVEPLLPSLTMPDPVACRAHLAVGKAQRKQRDHVKAAATLAMVVKKCRDPEVRAKALFTLGFSQSVTNAEAAVETYEQLVREFPEHALADDALFFAAEQRLRAGDLEGSSDRLAELADRFPTSDYGADGLFKLFWVRRSQGDRDGALEVLDEIEARFEAQEESHELERARYWRARTLEEQGQKADAVAVLMQNAAAHPATYYGLLSRERAEQLAPHKAKAIQRSVTAAARVDDVFPLPAGAMADDLQFKSAVELLRLGFGELVPMEIINIERAKLPPESHRLLVVMLAMAGEERPAHGMARLWLRKDLSGPITRKTRLVWEIAYPKAFRELVESAAESADELDPDLLQALMREESALDPKALSWAGALGLCQLMPYTAAEVAAQLKLPRPTHAQLLEPELNVKLGARYLADLVARFEGVRPFAVASYNAGPGAVGRWRRERPTDDLAAWVEQIPLQETRNYVKRVLRSFNTYKLLYSPDDFARTTQPPPEKRPKKADKKA